MAFQSDEQRKAVMAILAELRKKTKAKKGDYILFHGSPPRNRKSIESQGLKAGKSVWNDMIQGVFLTPTAGLDQVQDWVGYKHYMDSDGDWSRTDPDIYAVAVPGQKTRQSTRAYYRLLTELQHPGESTDKARLRKRMKNRDMHEFIYYDSIPAENIVRLTDGEKLVLGTEGMRASNRRWRRK